MVVKLQSIGNTYTYLVMMRRTRCHQMKHKNRPQLHKSSLSVMIKFNSPTTIANVVENIRYREMGGGGIKLYEVIFEHHDPL
jgi:hypothetical protein